MIRAPLGEQAYWDEYVEFQIDAVDRMAQQIRLPPGNPAYRPQYLFELAKEFWHLSLGRYSRGDAIDQLALHIPPLLDAWEQSEALGKQVWTEKQQYTRRAWTVNLDHYIVCFWLVGLALALEIPDEHWQRLLALIGNEGEDELLDRVIASRSPGRRIGTKLCHPKPYQRLLDTINAAPDQRCWLSLYGIGTKNSTARLNPVYPKRRPGTTDLTGTPMATRAYITAATLADGASKPWRRSRHSGWTTVCA